MRYGQEKSVKMYYTISEVVDLTGIPAHILRYWEQEFPMLRPRKNRAGNRTYKERDIALIRRIQQLVQVERFTVEGALKRLRDEVLPDEPSETEQTETPVSILPEIEVKSPEANQEPEVAPARERKTQIITQLREIRDLLR